MYDNELQITGSEAFLPIVRLLVGHNFLKERQLTPPTIPSVHLLSLWFIEREDLARLEDDVHTR